MPQDPSQLPRFVNSAQVPVSFIERIRADKQKHLSAIDYLDKLISLYESSPEVQKFVSLSENQ